jgi:hypothetical protein
VNLITYFYLVLKLRPDPHSPIRLNCVAFAYRGNFILKALNLATGIRIVIDNYRDYSPFLSILFSNAESYSEVT